MWKLKEPSQAEVTWFKNFRDRCEAREANGTWPNEFSQAISSGVLAAGVYPQAFARQIGMTVGAVLAWVNGIRSPTLKNAVKLERILDMRPGSISQFATCEKAVSAGVKKLWDRRRKRARTVEERRRRHLAGEYHKGTPPIEAALRGPHVGSKGTRTIGGRIRVSIARVCGPSSGQFVECPACRKALYRPNSILVIRNVSMHPECGLVNRRHHPRGFRPPRRKGVDITERVRITLLKDGLGMTSRQIHEKENPGQVYTEALELSINQRVRLGRLDLEDQRWGELLPANERRPGHIHRRLRNFPVLVVLQIARGQHPLSSVTDIQAVEKWFPQPKVIDPLKGYEVADNPLAKVVAATIRQGFPTVFAASKSAGMNYKILELIVTAPRQRLWNTTVRALSGFTGLAEDEIRRLNEAQAQGPTKLSKTVGKAIHQQYGSITAVTKSTGLHKNTLRSILLDCQGISHKNRTWEALSVLTGLSETELRELNQPQALAPVK